MLFLTMDHGYLLRMSYSQVSATVLGGYLKKHLNIYTLPHTSLTMEKIWGVISASPGVASSVWQSYMEAISEYWEVLVALFAGIVTAVKLKQETQELRKDVEDIHRRDTYIEVVRLRAELDTLAKNNTQLWEMVNKLRDRL